MHHELFALFSDSDRAAQALRELASRPELEGRYSIVVHENQIEGETTDPAISAEERGTRSGMRFGFLLGGLHGVGVMAVARLAFGLVVGGPLATILAAAGAGALIGGFIGTLCGHAYEDPHLAHLASHLEKGGALVSVNVEALETEHEVETLLQRHGAKTTHRALI